MLDQLSTPALVTLHNRLANEDSVPDVAHVNRFADRATAIKRVGVLLERTGMEVVSVDEGVPTLRRAGDLPPAVEGQVEVEDPSTPLEGTNDTPPAKKERKRRGFRFVFPKKDEIKECRAGTKRAQVVELLSRPDGATLEEIMAETGWSQKDAYEGTRLVHFYLGYGMKQDENGRVRLVK